MNIMFKIDANTANPIREFRIINFLSPYKTFFTSTLFYESFSMVARMGMFEYLQISGPSKNNAVINGPLAGLLT